MSDLAAHLVDRVLTSEVGWRKYVMMFPAELAVGLCFDADLAAAVTRVCARVLAEFQRGRSNPTAPGRPSPACVHRNGSPASQSCLLLRREQEPRRYHLQSCWNLS